MVSRSMRNLVSHPSVIRCQELVISTTIQRSRDRPMLDRCPFLSSRIITSLSSHILVFVFSSLFWRLYHSSIFFYPPSLVSVGASSLVLSHKNRYDLYFLNRQGRARPPRAAPSPSASATERVLGSTQPTDTVVTSGQTSVPWPFSQICPTAHRSCGCANFWAPGL